MASNLEQAQPTLLQKAAISSLATQAIEWSRIDSPTPLYQEGLLKFVDLSVANRLIGPFGGTYVQNGHRDKARRYWEDAKMPPEVIDTLLTRFNRLKYYVSRPMVKAIMRTGPDQSPRQAGQRMVQALYDLYENNRYALAASIRRQAEDGTDFGIDGFNAHQVPHIMTVVEGTVALLEQADYLGFRGDIDSDTYLAGALGAAGHDVGNILSRKLHARVGPRVLERVMHGITTHRLWDRIQDVVVFHNEPEMAELIKNAWHTQGNATETIKQMARLRPEILAAIIADKLHIGQDRLPPEWTDPNGLLRDLHVGINAVFKTQDAGYTQNGNKFIINLAYNQAIEGNPDHPANEKADRDPNRYHLKVPDAIDAYLTDPERASEDKLSHSEVMEAVMWSKQGYRERLRLTIMAAFAFNPNAQEVEINILDPEAHIGLDGKLDNERIEQIKHRQYTFTRDNIDQLLEEINTRFAEKIKVEDLKTAGDKLLPRRST